MMRIVAEKQSIKVAKYEAVHSFFVPSADLFFSSAAARLGGIVSCKQVKQIFSDFLHSVQCIIKLDISDIS